MTPQPPANPNAELLKQLVQLETEAAQQRLEIAARLDALIQLVAQIADRPASQPAPAQPAGNVTQSDTIIFTATTISMAHDEKTGNPAYKLKGGQYNTFGVRIWPEILPALGINPDHIKPGPNPLPEPIAVRVELNTEGKPRKVIGPA